MMVTQAMDKREPVFWDTPDAEDQLLWESEDDAIEGLLEDMDDFPEKLIIAGYARMEVSIGWLHPLEDCLEAIDEEFGNPDGDSFEPTQAMKDAEAAFLTVLKREYKPWACEVVCRKTIDVMAWIREKRPDWLSGKGEE